MAMTSSTHKSLLDEIPTRDYETFDPSLSASITSQLHVPPAAPAVESPSYGNRLYGTMSVPDKILVAGSGSHTGVRTSRGLGGEVDFTSFMDPDTIIPVRTPPTVLTVDEDDEENERKNQTRAAPRQKEENIIVDEDSDDDVKASSGDARLYKMTPASSHSLRNVSMFPATPEGVDDLTFLRYQVFKMQKRLARLESSDRKHTNRELVLLVSVLGFVTFKALRWFMRLNADY